MFNETYSESYVFEKLAYCRKHNLDPSNSTRIVPTSFSTEGKKMLQHAKSLIEDPKGLVLIHPLFDQLLTSLRTAVAEEYKLQKDEQTRSLLTPKRIPIGIAMGSFNFLLPKKFR